MVDVKSAASSAKPAAPYSIVAPFRTPIFRWLWLGSLFSNLALMFQAVAAGWAMTQLTPDKGMVALVQTALMLPILLLSLFTGALADMYDKRNVSMAALLLSLCAAVGLALLAATDLLTPWILLTLCSVFGAGLALLAPAWQAMLAEQVPTEILPQAFALNFVSYNVARSIGPAFGGMIVAAAGTAAAFGTTATLYLPLILILLLWRKRPVSDRAAPVGIWDTIISGLQFAVRSRPIMIVLARALALGIAAASISALLPLVARDLLGGGPETYGIILGAYGVGAVLGAINIGRIRHWFSGNQAVALSCLAIAAAVVVMAFSQSLAVTLAALVVAGAGWILCVTLLMVGVQLASPPSIAGRTLAIFQAAMAGGLAIGSGIWGSVAQNAGTGNALIISAGAIVATVVLGIWLQIPKIEPAEPDLNLVPKHNRPDDT